MSRNNRIEVKGASSVRAGSPIKEAKSCSAWIGGLGSLVTICNRNGTRHVFDVV